MLGLIIAGLVVLWLIGLMAKMAGKTIHLVLLVAVLILVVALLTGHKLF